MMVLSLLGLHFLNEEKVVSISNKTENRKIMLISENEKEDFSSLLCDSKPSKKNDNNKNSERSLWKKQSSEIVVEQTTKKVLKGQNVHLKMFPASTTKVLTALVVLDNLQNLDELQKVDKRSIGIEGSSVYLKENEKISSRNLLYGLMLRSGNDCAVELAIRTAESVEQFSKMMNETAKKCGAINSNFTNPHGLQDENHFTTAYDLAMIASKAMENETFAQIVSAKYAKVDGEEVRMWKNKNKILWQYEGGNGVKTGYTKTSGRCLVASAKRNGMQVVSVVLNHGDMWNDAQNLMNYAFENYTIESILQSYIPELQN